MAIGGDDAAIHDAFRGGARVLVEGGAAPVGVAPTQPSVGREVSVRPLGDANEMYAHSKPWWCALTCIARQRLKMAHATRLVVHSSACSATQLGEEVIATPTELRWVSGALLWP